MDPARANEAGGSSPNVAVAAQTCDVYVTPDGIMYVSDWNAGLHVLEYQG